MKTKLLVLVLLGWVATAWGQNRKASIKQLNLFTRTEKVRTEKAGVKIEKDSTFIQPTLFWAQYDTTRRGSMLYVDKNQRIRMLSENPPDAALQTITEITAKVKGLKGDIGEAEAAFKAQKSIAELGKRTAAVNMLRDALYRLNELYYATADEKKDIQQFIQNLSNKNASINIQMEGEKANINELSMFQTTLASSEITKLFTSIIGSTEEIAKEEAKVDLESEKTKQEEAKAEILKNQIIMTALQKVEGNLSKEDLDKLLKEIVKTIK
ncbi:hypothetical protein I6H88_17485 [Elizabethkingia bruuniana]|uniref:Uncharacterized protein n=1 Tax=Elizabethkingia bruuniana TaxID=1756149 RepID=A0A7T7UY56_9FLAO|nr:hypothetical protein [Elizabethkingia bruuniana]AQX84730.1 hypothetical protein AYC65_06795 [Elizabethkingia bruuniana]KUY29087.1 hypothetical protein ATB97_02875 [Elizabethkingia bruuniana]OPB70714.1 hypothetical protein BAY12_18985 [Elizabethkingia bruuniana]QDZ62739.1 hypothetical protein EVD20_08420 [Elizabethkingia bruuniana]QQN58199.1 hypothetical protein I6H88_17485 [Elizabethkingia bruuniana]